MENNTGFLLKFKKKYVQYKQIITNCIGPWGLL